MIRCPARLTRGWCPTGITTHDRTGPRDPANVEADAEQLPPRREPVFNMPGVVVAFIAICVIASSRQATTSSTSGNISGCCCTRRSSRSSMSGQLPVEFYPVAGPVTYSLLHGSIAHLAVNMIWLAAFGSPLANRIGPLRFVLVLGRHLDRSGRPALHPLHDQPGAADRRVGRDLAA